MEHAAFVDAYRRGAVKTRVDRSKAGYMYGDPVLLPAAVRRRQATQRLIAFAGVVGGLVSLIWLPWWAGLGITVFFLASMREIQKAAAEGVLEAALVDARVYDEARARGVLQLEPTGDAPGPA